MRVMMLVQRGSWKLLVLLMRLVVPRLHCQVHQGQRQSLPADLCCSMAPPECCSWARWMLATLAAVLVLLLVLVAAAVAVASPTRATASCEALLLL
jgi:hypothetical protein